MESALDTIATATLAQSFPQPIADVQEAQGRVDSNQPRLTLIKQGSSSRESILQNGLQKEVHVVVKNTPFTVNVGHAGALVWDGGSLDFRHLMVDVVLVYDNFERKPVGYVKSKPLEVKQHVSDRGDELSLHVKLKLLTSHHEDMFFRLLITAAERSTGSPLDPPLRLFTEPIKVISKPKQPQKRRRTTKKKSINETLFELMDQIERNQIFNTQLTHDLLLQGGADTMPSVFPGASQIAASAASLGPTSSQSPRRQPTLANSAPSFLHISASTSASTPMPPPAPEDPLANAVRRFVAAYNQLPVEEKPSKIHRVMKEISGRETESLAELLHHLLAAPRVNAKKKGDKSGCACQVCPHMLELERIDSFYTEFLMTPVFTEAETLGGFSGLL